MVSWSAGQLVSQSVRVVSWSVGQLVSEKSIDGKGEVKEALRETKERYHHLQTRVQKIALDFITPELIRGKRSFGGR